MASVRSFGTTVGTTLTFTPQVGDVCVFFSLCHFDITFTSVSDDNPDGLGSGWTTSTFAGSPDTGYGRRNNRFGVSASTTLTIAMSGAGALWRHGVYVVGGVPINKPMSEVYGANSGSFASPNVPSITPANIEVPNADQVVLLAVTNGNNPTAITPPSGFTSDYSGGDTTPAGFLLAHRDSGGSSPFACGGSNSSNGTYRLVAVNTAAKSTPPFGARQAVVGRAASRMQGMKQGWRRTRHGILVPELVF